MDKFTPILVSTPGQGGRFGHNLWEPKYFESKFEYNGHIKLIGMNHYNHLLYKPFYGNEILAYTTEECINDKIINDNMNKYFYIDETNNEYKLIDYDDVNKLYVVTDTNNNILKSERIIPFYGEYKLRLFDKILSAAHNYDKFTPDILCGFNKYEFVKYKTMMSGFFTNPIVIPYDDDYEKGYSFTLKHNKIIKTKNNMSLLDYVLPFSKVQCIKHNEIIDTIYICSVCDNNVIRHYTLSGMVDEICKIYN